MEGFSNKTKNGRACPYTKANWLSKITYWWMNPLFRAGWKRTLTKDDLYDIMPTDDATLLTDRLQRAWESEVEFSQRKRTEPHLFKTILFEFRKEFLYFGIFLFLSECLRLLQPYLIGELIGYFQPESHLSPVEMYCIAAALGLSGFLRLIFSPWYVLQAQYLGVKMKAAIGGLIYRKVLKISSMSLHKTTTGQIVNHLSTDLEKFNYALESFHYVWAAPLEVIIIMYLIYMYVGPASLFVLPVFVCIMPLQCFLGRLFGKLRLKIGAKTDRRIHVMNEIITGMRVIKMYCWEKPFGQIIAKLRKSEIASYRVTNVAVGLNIGLFLIASPTLMVSIVCGTLLLDLRFPFKSVFSVFGWVECLKMTVFRSLFAMIQDAMELLSSTKRIQRFLVLEEMPDMTQRNNDGRIVYTKDYSAEYSVDIKNMTAVWSGVEECKETEQSQATEHSKMMLKENEEMRGMFSMKKIDIKVKKGNLIAVVGAVGSGKTSLLMTILGELPATEGSIKVNGTLGYASQQPWIVSGTISENILFGEKYDEDKYHNVLRVCALDKFQKFASGALNLVLVIKLCLFYSVGCDIEQMKHGDQTLVGERGLLLSGGQKARLTLARCIYKNVNIYIMDDPLGAVDTEVGRHLFNKCICEYLEDKTRILVTHQLQYLRTVDQIILLKEGCVISTGTYEELMTGSDELSKVLSDLNEEEEEEVTQNEDRANILQTSSEKVEMPEEDIVTGKVGWHVYREYISSGYPAVTVPVLILFAILTESSFIFGEWHLAKWAENQFFETGSRNLSQAKTDIQVSNISTGASLICTGGTNCQSYDTFSNDSFIPTPMTSVYNVTTPVINDNRNAYIYIVSISVYVVAILISSVLFFITFIIAGKRLHNKMFYKLLGAKTRFFDSNPVGRILNRFSRDVGLMDDLIPRIAYANFEISFRMTALVITTCVINPLLLVPLCPLVIFIIITRNYSIDTTRHLKRIEAVLKSPVYSHMSDTLHGLQSIRALNVNESFIKEFDAHQNRHTIAEFLFLSSFRWFSIRTLFGVIIYFNIVISLSLILKDVIGLTGGLYGLALTYVVMLADPFELLMRLSAQLETFMTSVERITAYTKLEQEAEKVSDNTPPSSWPSSGEIVLNNLSLKYSSDSDTVLRHINCTINGKEKIGIVGRTGAGKSSLLASLLRLADPSGEIRIDGVNIFTLGLHELRSKISVIPQDPILFSGTLRQNLDPFEEYNDGQLWISLQQVELKTKIEGMHGQLYTDVSEGGKNFSVGQRQLVCLARAVLHYTRILILDEATANVDHKTDELIQTTIRERFRDCTVLTVAHRLHTIMDSDRVMVLDNGELKEFDIPYKLLQKEDGYFRRLVDQTGKPQSQQLQALALQFYQQRAEKK